MSTNPIEGTWIQPQQTQPPAQPQPTLVTFRSERVVRHAAILFLVVTYLWIGLMTLLFLLTIGGGLSSL